MIIIINSDLKDQDFNFKLFSCNIIDYECDYDDENQLYIYIIDNKYHDIMHNYFFKEIIETTKYNSNINFDMDTTIKHTTFHTFNILQKSDL